MRRFRRWLLWGVLLTPVLLLPGILFFSKIGLNHRLNRELTFGVVQVQFYNANLSWDLKFTSDSLTVRAPRFWIRSGPVSLQLSLREGPFQIKPRVQARVPELVMGILVDSLSEEERINGRKRRKPLVFPDIRIPVPIQIAVSKFAVQSSAGLGIELFQVDVKSQGPKGFAFNANRILLNPSVNLNALKAPLKKASPKIPLTGDGEYRFSARWFGRTVRYQVHLQDAAGAFLHLEGGRKKSNLRQGSDSLDLFLQGLAGLDNFLPLEKIPGVTNIQIHLVANQDSVPNLRTRFSFKAPPIFVLGPQQFEGTGFVQDTTAKLELKCQGDSGESAALSGIVNYKIPELPDDIPLLHSLSAHFKGFTRNVRLRIGGRKLPGDLEIQSLTLHRGLHFEAEVQTKDSSALHLVFQREKREPANPWTLDFDGKISPRESWAHAWTDTNLSYRQATVRGTFKRNMLDVEARIKDARAYGAAADSLYTQQIVNKKGYYLKQSRLAWKGINWPVLGKVEWGSKVTLDFQAKHPDFGFVAYSMPGPRSMEVKVQDLIGDKLPYPKLARLMELEPKATGFFNWDWAVSSGHTHIVGAITLAGKSLDLEAKGNWTATLLNLEEANVVLDHSKLKLFGELRLHGRQFYQIRKIEPQDIKSVTLATEGFEASSLAAFWGRQYPILGGALKGRMAYIDSTGFQGQYRVENLDLRALKGKVAIPQLTLLGEGESLVLSAVTQAEPTLPWLTGTAKLKVSHFFNSDQELEFKAQSENGFSGFFQGQMQNFRSLAGTFGVSGVISLPKEAGKIKDVNLEGQITLPFTPNIRQALKIKAGSYRGKYAMLGLDTMTFHGGLSMENGVLTLPDLGAENSLGPSLAGSVLVDIRSQPKIQAKLQAKALDIKWTGIQKLALREAKVGLELDSLGLRADAKIGQVDFQSTKAPASMSGNLENLSLTFIKPLNSSRPNLTEVSNAQLFLDGKVRNYLFQHKLGFREVQKFFRTVKSDKRRKKMKPIDLKINLETVGASNRIETDFLRMNFKGNLGVNGVYPYTLFSGQFSSLAGELGQSSQSYEIGDFDLKWQNATLEEGRLSVEGSKRLRYDCKPETKRTCNVFVKLDGRLDEMAFSYDSDCGGNSGGAIEPAALINSVSRGCYSGQYVAGAGGENYGEAMVNFLEPTLNNELSQVGQRYSLGWIKTTQVSGMGSVLSKSNSVDSSNSEPISIKIETKEKWGMSFKANAGYHPASEQNDPWENKVAFEWRPPLEKVAQNSEWKRRVRDRVMFEASAENRLEERIGEGDKNQVRMQAGVTYHYKFWNLW